MSKRIVEGTPMTPTRAAITNRRPQLKVLVKKL
jgi:hypothetical protein